MEGRSVLIAIALFCLILFGLIYFALTNVMKPDSKVADLDKAAKEDQAWETVPALSKAREAYEDNAIAAGRAAVYAQRIHHATSGHYAKNLEELKEIDRSFLSDPGVIFVFGEVTDEDFEFTTSHQKGRRTYVWK